jgi:uncharacterized surface protein with fasciclin (FAS1) repeats
MQLKGKTMKKTMLNVVKMFGLSLAFVSTLAAATESKTIVENAVATADLSTLVTAIKTAELVNTLNGPGPFTVFAPSNEAFSALPTGALDSLLKNKPQLTKVLTYHVVSGTVMSKDIKPGMVKTVEGQDINITMQNGNVMVNDAKVIKADIKAKNGVIHIIDKVLMPK